MRLKDITEAKIPFWAVTSLVVPAVWWAAMWVADMNHKIDTAEKQLVRTKEECELGVKRLNERCDAGIQRINERCELLERFCENGSKNSKRVQTHERDGT